MTRMLSRGQALVLGLIVLLGLILGGLGLFAVGNQKWLPDAFHVRVAFDDAGGVELGTRVHIQGIDAGEVEEIELPAEPGAPVILHLRLAGKFRHLVRTDAKIQIASENLFSGKIVRIVPGSPTAVVVSDNQKLIGQPGGDLTDQVAQAAGKLTKVLSEVDQALYDFQSGQGPLGEAAGDLKAATAKINAVLAKADQTLQEIGDGKGTLGKLLKDEKLYGELTKTLTQVNGLVQDVQDGKGSLGKMVNNTELYLEALKSLKDLQGTMTSFKQNADAIKSLPVISSYVVDVNKELNRPDATRHRLVLAADKLFEPGKSILTDAGKTALDETAAWFTEHKEPNSEVVIAGYADPAKNDAAFAQTLTQKQSEAVADYLRTKHKIHRMGFWAWSNRRVVALGCGTGASPVPEKEKLPPSRIELIVFVPIK